MVWVLTRGFDVTEQARLYTRSGDDGTTGLFGGGRVGKDHPLVEAYGTVDELNAALGLAVAACPEPSTEDAFARFHAIFGSLQSRLFDVGADLATPLDSPHADKIVRISERHVSEIEAWIDEIDAENAPMRHFVLPGGSSVAAALHLARTICRRAERQVVTAAATSTINHHAGVFLNRVGDLLFSMARRANGALGRPDVPWQPETPE